MSRQRQSDRVTYRTYDGRPVTRAKIEEALAELEGRERRRVRRERFRAWLLTALMVALILAAVVILIWRLATL